jgi:glycosyltransferase involved in cell wall biosynthesis
VRVLHVIRNLNDGGMERIVADLVAAMGRREEIDPHVLSLEPGGRFADILRGYAEIHIAQRGTKLSLLRPARLAADIARIAPDIVHAHSGTWFKTARAARMAGTRRVVYTEHGRQFPDPLLNRVLDGVAARLTDSVVVVSASLREHMIRHLWVRDTQTRVIVNGIDVEAVRAIAPMSDATIREARVVTFVTVGRLEPVKGLNLLVDVMQQWPESAPGCRVLIAGDGSQRD